MNLGIGNIVIGVFVLVVISFLFVSLYTSLYMRYAVKKELERKRFLISTGVISLSWVVVTLISVMFVSNQEMLIFGVFSFSLIFFINLFLAEKLFKFETKHKVFYSLFLAVIINPTWYFLLV